MNSYTTQSCRACLLQDNVCNMYDLAVSETLELYIQCSNVAVSLKTFPAAPQHLCSMCYRLCEMIESFRERCQETEKKLLRGAKLKRKAAKVSGTVAEPRPPVKAEASEADGEGNEMPLEVETNYGAVEYDDPMADAGEGNEEVDHEETCAPAQIDIQWDDYESESDTKKTKKKRKSDTTTWNALNPDDFLWGPGPNDTGVWKHFMREASRKYAKCTEEGCSRVLCCPNGSTTSMRTHLTKVHGMEVPLRPKTWLVNSN